MSKNIINDEDYLIAGELIKMDQKYYQEISKYNSIAPSAIIDKSAKIGKYVIIGENVKIGPNCKIGNYCEIRDDCVLCEGVSMGSRCTLSAGTYVGDFVVIKYGFVATDTPDLSKDLKSICILSSMSRYGANVTIMPGVCVGFNSEIGACSQVRHNVPDNEIWYGNPAKFYKKIEVNNE
jgi:UDP-2-acetamido-3-amino-2,3-dideoxy-glucuronate N-acetyltransferase